MLILAHRPFAGLHAYAETGPIFIFATACMRGGGSSEVPAILTTSHDYLIKGYSADERIIYGTGEIVATTRIEENNPEEALGWITQQYEELVAVCSE